MIDGDLSYRNYAADEREPGYRDRAAKGPALLAVLGLSLLGWAAIIVPLVAILHL